MFRGMRIINVDENVTTATEFHFSLCLLFVLNTQSKQASWKQRKKKLYMKNPFTICRGGLTLTSTTLLIQCDWVNQVEAEARHLHVQLHFAYENSSQRDLQHFQRQSTNNSRAHCCRWRTLKMLIYIRIRFCNGFRCLWKWQSTLDSPTLWSIPISRESLWFSIAHIQHSRPPFRVYVRCWWYNRAAAQSNLLNFNSILSCKIEWIFPLTCSFSSWTMLLDIFKKILSTS